MSPTWYVFKCLVITFAIISFLQIRIGSESKTLEIYFTDWMKSLSASKRIQDVANGGKELTSDFIREFTTPDGRKVYIQESETFIKRQKASNTKVNTDDAIDTNLIQRLMSGIKLNLNDLDLSSQKSIKEQFKKELELEIKKDYEAKLKKSGIDPNTLESTN